MWCAAIAVVAAIASAEHANKASRGAISGREREPIKPAQRSLEELAREHRRKMDEMHRETMMSAKIGTALILAVLVAAGRVAWWLIAGQ